MKKIDLKPELSSMEQATAFFETSLSGSRIPAKVIAQVNVIVDEVFSNIVYYGGASSVTLGCIVGEDAIHLRFSDNGRPYDPTQRPDPDIATPIEAREPGGMGIYIAKKLMDSISYVYQNGLNVLVLEKSR